MRVLVADDHDFFRGGLVSELSQIIPDACFFEAANAGETLSLLEINDNIDLVILDLCMPGSNKYDLVEQVCSKYPQLKVIVMTASEEIRDMQGVIDCGAVGYIPKTLGRDVVHHAIGLVLAGGAYFPDDVLNEQTIEQAQLAELEKRITTLTQRQKDVLKLLLEGNTNKSIACSLKISDNTVKIHVTAILKTLSFSSRAQVIAGARDIVNRVF